MKQGTSELLKPVAVKMETSGFVGLAVVTMGGAKNRMDRRRRRC